MFARCSRIKSLYLTFLGGMLLAGCGSGEGGRDSTSSGTYADESEALLQAERDAAQLLGAHGERSRAAWSKSGGGGSWTQTVLQEFKKRRPSLETARDLEEFCPGYETATDFQKETCWLRIVSAMAWYESSFRPGATYKEHTGSTSVGLLMMNPEHCPKAKTVAALKVAVSNIQCAMARMELLVARDRYVSGPDAERGAAAYWSVLRRPYKFRDLFLGRRNQILRFTRTYAAYALK